METKKTNTIAKVNTTDLVVSLENHHEVSNAYLAARGVDSPEFVKEYQKTLSDLLFSQDEEGLEKLQKTRTNSLLNAVFIATESRASFAKREISFIPFEIFKKEKVNGVERKIGTGKYNATLIFDINFQKQQILKLENCKRFFTAQIHEGVEICHDLESGRYIFDGKNDITKETVGYYAVFITTSDERYELFMTCDEIVQRAGFSPQFKPDNYKNKRNNIHFEKIVVRNLLKLIPKLTTELKSIVAADEIDFTPYEDVTVSPEQPAKENRLEAAKKQLSVTQTEKTDDVSKNEQTPEIEPKNEPNLENSENAKKDVEEHKNEAKFDETFF